MPLNSSLEKIHYKFGLTCKRGLNINLFVFIAGIIDNPLDSLFTYGENGGWSTFYKPDFVQTEFPNSEIEDKAHEVH